MKEINGYLSLAGGNDVKKDKGSFNRPPQIDSLLSSSFDPFVRGGDYFGYSGWYSPS